MSLLGWAILSAILYVFYAKNKQRTIDRKVTQTAKEADERLTVFTITNATKRSAKQSPSKSKPQQTKRQSADAQEWVDDEDWDDNDDDGDLLTFRVSYGKNNEIQTQNNTPAIWKQPGETVQIGGFTLSGGFFYFGGQLDKINSSDPYFYHQTEASLLDETLPTLDEGVDYEDESLGYWPKYSSLSPSCRGAYLAWLAGPRTSPDTPLGYVFIYFYGLERRLLVDFNGGKVSETECRRIYQELLRLKQIYGKNNSFNQYSTRLIEYLSIIAPQISPINEANIEASLNSLLFKYHLATVVNTGEPVSAQLALLWSKANPENRLRTPARRCATQFEQLFKMRYQEKFAEGLVIKPNKTKLKFDYHPASGSLRGIDTIKFDLPDPSVLTAPLKKLTALAESCTDELDPYSRYLGRKDSSREDLAGLLLLPECLLTMASSPLLASFHQWATEQITTRGGVVTVAEFWQKAGQSVPTRLNKKEMELMTNLCHRTNLGFAPDARYHHVKPAIEGGLVLFNPGHGAYFEPSDAFNAVAMMLRLGAMMARIDGHVDDTEKALLDKLIDHRTTLSTTEKNSLHAYLLWRLHAPVNMTGLKARLEKLSGKEKGIVSQILIRVALADGTIDPNEIKQLEKLYTALGLDKTSVASDIHQVSATKIATKAATSQQSTEYASVQLDANTLALHESETQAVQTMLGAIFTDDDEITDNEEEAAEDTSDSRLDTKHLKLYTQLLKKDEWPRDELQLLCKELGLMPDGAIEAINEWSYEIVDAPVLEDDGNILLDREIVDELMAEEG